VDAGAATVTATGRLPTLATSVARFAIGVRRAAHDAVDGSPPREQRELRRMNGRRAMGQVVVVGLDIASPFSRCTALIATVRWSFGDV